MLLPLELARSMRRHHAMHLRLSKQVMLVVSYGAKCVVCNSCTSNSFH